MVANFALAADAKPSTKPGTGIKEDVPRLGASIAAVIAILSAVCIL
jgi:hypothetical protein